MDPLHVSFLTEYQAFATCVDLSKLNLAHNDMSSTNLMVEWREGANGERYPHLTVIDFGSATFLAVSGM